MDRLSKTSNILGDIELAVLSASKNIENAVEQTTKENQNEDYNTELERKKSFDSDFSEDEEYERGLTVTILDRLGQDLTSHVPRNELIYERAEMRRPSESGQQKEVVEETMFRIYIDKK